MSPYNNSLLPSLAVEPKLVMEKQITLNLQRANSTAFSNNDKSPFVYNWNTSDFEQNKEWVKKYSFNYSHRLIWSPEVTNSGKVQWTMFSSCLFFFFFKFNIPPSTCHTRTSFVENWKILCHRYNIFNGEVKSMTLAERLHFWKVTTYNILGCNTEAWIKGIYSNQEAGVPTNYSCVSLAQGSSKSYRYL